LETNTGLRAGVLAAPTSCDVYGNQYRVDAVALPVVNPIVDLAAKRLLNGNIQGTVNSAALIAFLLDLNGDPSRPSNPRAGGEGSAR